MCQEKDAYGVPWGTREFSDCDKKLQQLNRPRAQLTAWGGGVFGALLSKIMMCVPCLQGEQAY